MSCLHWLGHSKWLMQQVVTSLECICWHCHCNLQLYCGSACLIAFTTLFTRSWSRVFFWSKLCYSCLHKNSFLKSKTNFKHRHRLWWFFWSHFCNLCFDTDKFYFITNSLIWIVLKIFGTHLSSFYEFCVTFRWKKSSIKHSNWAVWWSGMIS